MDPLTFHWLRKPGHAVAALADAPAPAPLATEALEGGSLWFVPLKDAKAHAALAHAPTPAHTDALAQPLAPAQALARLPKDAWPLFPADAKQVPAVVDAWLWLYEQAPQGIEEAVLQVTDDPAHLRDYLEAEQALWNVIYAAHPHQEDEGIYPGALAEARWLVDTVLDAPGYEEHSEFLTMSAFETLARELLLTVRKAELQHLQQHLRGIASVSGW